MQSYTKKRRAPHGPSKNELRSARAQQDERQRTQTGSLRQRFDYVKKLDIDLKLETTSGAILDQVRRTISLDEPLLLDVPCAGGCSNGVFLLTEAIETLLKKEQETRDGIAYCQAPSYADTRTPCGTKLTYRISIQYDGDKLPSVTNNKENNTHE